MHSSFTRNNNLRPLQPSVVVYMLLVLFLASYTFSAILSIAVCCIQAVLCRKYKGSEWAGQHFDKLR